MPRESLLHIKLKKIAKLVLKEEGVDRIEEEYGCLINGKHYIVDIVGFFSNKTVAIECGSVPQRKLKVLKSYFDEAILFTVFNIFDYLDSWIQRLENTLQIERSKPSFKGKILGLSKSFQKGKTQIPREVRKSLGIEDGDKLLWIIDNGKWVIEHA